MEWFKMLLWACAWAECTWSGRSPVWLCGAACTLMRKLLLEELISPEAVLYCGRDDACPGGAVLLTALVLSADRMSTSVAEGVWWASRQSRTLLMWVSCVVVSLSCYESSSIQCLSLADCLSCWPSLVDNTAREHSVVDLVVMVVIVMMSDAVFCWVILSQGFVRCSASTEAVLSIVGDLLRADGPGWVGTAGPFTPQTGMSLDSSAHSLARARVQLVLYGRGWPLWGLPLLKHPSTCVSGVQDMGSMQIMNNDYKND